MQPIKKKNKKRILISLTYYLPNISGLTLYAGNLAQGLARKGYEVTIVTSQHDKRYPRRSKSGKIKIIRIPVVFSISKGPIMPRLPFVIWKEIGNSDIVNCHLPQFESIIVAIFARIMKKKLITTYQCDLSMKRGIFERFIRSIVFGSQFVACLLSDSIVVTSIDYSKNSSLLRIFKDKISPIYPPISKMYKRRKFIKQRKEISIGLVSRFSEEKGIEYLLNAIPLLQKKIKRKFMIKIVGPKNPVGEKNYFKRLLPLLQKYQKNIILLGELSNVQLERFYSSIDVLVLPSVDSTEAFGMVQVEAMLRGVPVVASNIPGVRVPILETKMGELTNPKDSRDLASKIAKVLANKRKYIRSSRSIEEVFSYNKTIEQYNLLF